MRSAKIVSLKITTEQYAEVKYVISGAPVTELFINLKRERLSNDEEEWYREDYKLNLTPSLQLFSEEMGPFYYRGDYGS